MADEDSLMKIVHREPNSSTESTSQMDVEMTSADTECAQALLDLARSFSGQQPVMPNQTRLQRPTVDSRSVLNPLSSNRSPPKRGHSLLQIKKTGMGRGSPGKRGRGRGGRNSNSFVRMFDPVIASKLGCKSPESLKEEVMRRIILDHSYASTPGLAKTIVDPAFYNLLDEVEGARNNKNSLLFKGFNRLETKQYAQNIMPAKAVDTSERNDVMGMKYYREKSGSDVNTARRSLDSLAQLLSSEISGHVKSSSECLGMKANPVLNKAESQNNTSGVAPDLYQPYDDKYKNFNLLLKCLTNDSQEIKTTNRKRSYSQTSVETGRKTIAQLTGTSQDVKCMHCMKVFSSGIYLLKHKRRAHPMAFPSATINSEVSSCPNCSLAVEIDKLEQHLLICSKKPTEMDLQISSENNVSINKAASNNATCQFCGVRMRRQMLVKHLATKHCIENKDQGNIENDGALSDSGSSTLSGTSDVENKCFSNSVSGDENIIQCDICFAFVPKPLLSQHVAEQHFNMVSGTGYTAGLQNGSVKEENDNKSETISDSHSYNNNVVSKSSNNIGNNKNVSPPSSGTFKQYMLHRFLSENPGSVTGDAVTESFTCQTGRVPSPNNVSSVVESVSSGFGQENSSSIHGSGSYTVVVRSETSSLHDTINALTERISPQMQV